MIIKHQQFDLLGKKILERAVFQAPIREPRALSEEACFLYSVQGTLELYAATEKVNLSSNEGIVMRCGNYLASHIKTDDQPSEAIAVHFYPDVLEFVYKDGLPDAITQAISGTSESKQIARVEIDHMLTNYVEGLLFYLKNTELINEELITLKIKELIMLLVNADSTYSQQVKGILRNMFNPLEATFRDMIQAHLYENLNLQELATLTNLSLSSFKRKFQSVYHETPAKYFREQRLRRASELLKQGEMRVKDICYQSGFNDVTSFTKLFTSYYGASPTKFREQ
ncbi:MAG: AraC family transcriptional regulator [Bacteroidota bacterium]